MAKQDRLLAELQVRAARLAKARRITANLEKQVATTARHCADAGVSSRQMAPVLDMDHTTVWRKYCQ